MSSNNLQESARKGDLSAIASVIQQAFTNHKVHVDAEMQFGVTLQLKLKSDKPLDSQSCLNVICKTLDNIKPEKVKTVRVSETSSKSPKLQVWNKHLGIKQGKFADNTKQTNRMSFAVCALVISGLLYAGVTQKPAPSTSPTAVQAVNPDQEAQAILRQVTQKYSYSRFIETWGKGTQGLYLPEEAWNELASSQRNTLINYAQSKQLKAIIIGKQLAPNNIALDRTVWGD